MCKICAAEHALHQQIHLEDVHVMQLAGAACVLLEEKKLTQKV